MRVLALIFCWLPALLTCAESGYPFLNTTVDSLVIAINRESHPSEVTGIWQATDDGAKVGILPARKWEAASGTTLPRESISAADTWAIVLLDSPHPTLQPGTFLGWLTPAAKPHQYQSTLYTKVKQGRLANPKRCVLTLPDDGHMTLRHIRKGLGINILKFLPYMFHGISVRGVVTNTDNTPADLNGFLKLYPLPSHPFKPLIL